MAYCTIEDLRSEGAIIAGADETRMTEVCGRVSDYIDRMTGNVFEARERTLHFDGTGLYRLDLPLCLIEPERITCDGAEVTRYVNYNRRDPDDRMNPRIFRADDEPWTKGLLNVVISGVWGCVDETLTGGGFVVPRLIKRAAMILALMQMTGLADFDAQKDEYDRRRLQSETTDGHSYTLDRTLDQLIASEVCTGIAEVDQAIMQYKIRHVRVAMA